MMAFHVLFVTVCLLLILTAVSLFRRWTRTKNNSPSVNFGATLLRIYLLLLVGILIVTLAIVWLWKEGIGVP